MSVYKYKKKPFEVDVLYFDGENADELRQFVGEGNLGYNVDGDSKFFISTLEGNMAFDADTYVIRGVEGEFYPCAKNIFEKTYELVTT